MKKILSICSVICMIVTASVAVSCSDLDLNESTYSSKELMFSDFAHVKQVMTNVYGYLGSGFMAIGGKTMLDCASDDAVYASYPDPVRVFHDGSWTPMNTIDDVWGRLYAAIRAANYFLENCPEDFPDCRYNDDYSRNMAQLVNYPWEAKALRAYFHAELLKRYGNIVIADRTYSPDEVNNLPQSSFDEAANWIASELAEAAKHLPDNYSGDYFAEIGRVTKGFALAARARVLLYAASPLNNPSSDAKKWARAAAAAKEMIDANTKANTYALQNFTKGMHTESRTVIYSVRENASSAFEGANFPIGYEGGNSGMCPSLNLVETFDMADGSVFDPVANADALLDPSQRDPRLAAYVLSNGDVFKDETIETFTGGRNGQPLANATPTSFYLKKFVIEKTSFTTGSIRTYAHIYPVYRLSEVYLNYAEALFEATGNPDFSGSLEGVTYSMSAREALNKVRAAYGMPGVPSSSPANFRARLRNERRVELCFEGHRFWDIRRWKIASECTKIYGLSITRDADEVCHAQKVLVAEREWNDKMYRYPISDVELHKNTGLTQNEGW